MKRIEIDVVDSKAGQDTLLSWAAKMDAGVIRRKSTPRLHFASYRQMHSTLTEIRVELLQHVAMHEDLSIRQLAVQLGRDYRNVHDDVQRLLELGLLEIDAGKLLVPYDEIDIHKTLRAVARPRIQALNCNAASPA